MKVEYQGKTFKVGRKARWIAADDDWVVFTFDDRSRPLLGNKTWAGVFPKRVGKLKKSSPCMISGFPLMKIKLTATLEEVVVDENSI